MSTTPALYPTPSRIALLKAIAAGEVHEDTFRAPYVSFHHYRRVTAQVKALYGAGWIELSRERARWITPWQLTAAGREVLDLHATPTT